MSDHHLSPENVRIFVQNAPHRALDVLRLMRERQDTPLADLAKELGVDKRVITTAVLRLNAAYRELTGGGQLVVREGRSYALTAAGIVVAEELSTAHQHLVEALRAASSKHREAWVPVASECIRYLPELAVQVRSKKKDIILKPSPKRSADLIASVSNRNRETRRRPYALFAACAFVDQISTATVSSLSAIGTEPDERAGRDEGVRRRPSEMIRIKDDPFRVVARAGRFGRDKTVHLADLWQMDLIVPDGGAVLDFLNLREPGWAHNHAHIRATDLQSVFACAMASRDLVPDPVMIFHGSDQTIARNLPGFELLNIADDESSEDRQLRAVTGFFRDREVEASLLPGQKEIWDTIWEAAADVWLADPDAAEAHPLQGTGA